MSAHFLTTTARLKPAQIRKLDKIAARHDADFVYIGRTPGNTTTGWFNCRDYGEHATRATSARVRADLVAEGLAAAYGLTG